MKINIKSLLTLGAAFALAYSCGPNSDEYDYTLNEKVLLTASESSFTVKQGETITIPVSLAQAIDKPATFKLEVLGGTPGETNKTEEELGFTAGKGFIPGDWGSDYPAFEVVIPAYTKDFNIELTALEVLNANSSKNVKLKLTEAGLRTALTPEGGILLDLTIVSSDNLTTLLAWDGEYTDGNGDAHSWCDFDLDILVFTDTFGGANFDAATGSCPERLSLEPGELPDGDYIIAVDYYTGVSTATAPSSAFTSIPARITFSKSGTFASTVDLSGIWTDFVTGGSNDGDSDGQAFQVIANMNISNGVYIITDPDTGSVIGQG